MELTQVMLNYFLASFSFYGMIWFKNKRQIRKTIYIKKPKKSKNLKKHIEEIKLKKNENALVSESRCMPS